MRSLLRWSALLLISVWLSACTTTPPPLVEDDAAAGGAVFGRSGRFAFSAENLITQERDAVQGGFVWQDSGHTLRMDFTSPLGATLARVRLTAQQAWLQTAQGQEYTAPTAQDLIARLFGAPVPVAPLRHWLRGKRDPGMDMDALQYDSQGRLTRFQQHGWQVSLSRHDAYGPRLLRLERHTRDQLLKLRLVVDDN